jgi:hypothetical protein
LCLDQAERCFRRDHAHESEARFLQQVTVLSLRAFPSAGYHQHVDIEELCFGWRVVDRNDALGDQEPRVSPHRAAARSQKTLRRLVVPVVQHALENVNVTIRQG